MKTVSRSHGIDFEWSHFKAIANQRKHGIDFVSACEVFFDPFVKVQDAGGESAEPRQAAIGMTESWQLLFVVFVELKDSLRIISARPATSQERRRYEDG